MTLRVAYDDSLLKWKLGKNHPTNPVRAKLAVDLLRDQLGAECDVRKIKRQVSVDELALVHDEAYVRSTLAGVNDEWSGIRPDLGQTAAHMFAGTVQLVDDLVGGWLRYGFSPQGAKHHAQRDHGSGFCVFNDFAYAATRLARAGMKVAYIDTDAHHGDGVENLTLNNKRILTASIHDKTIFPGTGTVHRRRSNAFNFALRAESGDHELVKSVLAIKQLLDSFKPNVLLWAIGGDGYVDDPLSSLRYTYAGYRTVARAIGAYAGRRGLPILFGGAGGYLPKTHTPRVWSTVVAETYLIAEQVRTAHRDVQVLV